MTRKPGVDLRFGPYVERQAGAFNKRWISEHPVSKRDDLTIQLFGWTLGVLHAVAGGQYSPSRAPEGHCLALPSIHQEPHQNSTSPPVQ